MKKFFIVFLALPLFFGHISNASAQNDLLTVQPQHNSTDPCAFNVTATNHNSQGKNIDEIVLTLSSTDIYFSGFTGPSTHWTGTIDPTTTIIDIKTDDPGIAPNSTLSNFIFSWLQTGTPSQYGSPYTITWTTENSGSTLSTGSFSPICTEFQFFTQIDNATVNTSQSGPDPCFAFTLNNRNLQGGTNGLTTDIYGVSFQLENSTGATLRPSKVTPATGWITDSVTATTAYFHADNNPILTGNSVGGWTVCLRSATSLKNFNFVWSAFDNQGGFIDRDTLFNIPNTATATATESDSMSVKAVNGCLYNVTLKNYHLSNQTPPSRIVRFVVRSKTAGVTFAAAPNAPTNWTKPFIAGSDSIVYLANTLADGIPDGIVSANQFSFSVNNPTGNNFDINWETDQAGSPFPSKFSFLSSGTVTTKCTVAATTADIAVNAPGLNECDYKLTVTNAHNVTPSNLTSLTLSIPATAGQLAGSTGPTGWNWGSNGASITCNAALATDDMPSGTSQDFLYSFSPTAPGTNVTVTWKTTDDQVPPVTTGTGTFTIKCSPIINICDTLIDMGSVNNDSCIETLHLNNRKNVAISQLSISATNGWTIVAADTPAGWTKQIVGASQVSYTSTDGLVAGGQQSFQLQFANYYPDTATVPPSNNFLVIWVSTDVNGATCKDTLIVVPGCLARPFHVVTGSVAAKSDNAGVTNFIVVPNPTRGMADISFDLNAAGHVTLAILDVLGNQVAALSNKMMSQGTYQFPYNMNSLPDGAYYIRIQTPFGVMTRKLILTK